MAKYYSFRSHIRCNIRKLAGAASEFDSDGSVQNNTRALRREGKARTGDCLVGGVAADSGWGTYFAPRGEASRQEIHEHQGALGSLGTNETVLGKPAQAARGINAARRAAEALSRARLTGPRTTVAAAGRHAN